jgi:dipeptidase D
MDEAGNTVVEVPATPGFEGAEPLVIQGHLDMVTEANRGSTHDFFKDPIELIVTTDSGDGSQFVTANGTTLGADNGIGVSLALAAATDPSVVHGPLEILLTVDEEMGMSGAQALQPGFFEGRRMLNLDSEEDTSIYIGCAGGMDTTFEWDLSTGPVDGLEARLIEVTGLRGGHSGCDIHENRGNAIKALVRVMTRLGPGLRLALVDGGSKRNAIPREASAILVGTAETLAEVASACAEVRALVCAESYEPDLKITSRPAEAVGALTVADTERVRRALMAVPSGVVCMHPKVEGLVQTSNNLSTIKMKVVDSGEAHLEVGLLSRSATVSLLSTTASTLASIGALAGAAVVQGGQYPGWEPNPDSPMLAACVDAYEGVFGDPPTIRAIHAGLECGIIGDRVGGVDAVSFGPNIKGAHSPDERVYVASVQKVWRYLKVVLEALARQG